MIQFQDFTDAQLERFRQFQRTSYDVLGEVASQLVPGVTERDATRWAMKAYRREGVDRYFHLPVALFGDRTALPDDPWTTESFFPVERVLEAGDAVILDASPMFEGFLVDTAISFTVGTDAAHAAVMADDAAYRQTILAAVRSGATFREIAVSVDADMAAHGYRNCHRLHPEGVLGHRVVCFPDPGAAPPTDPGGFDPTLIGWFVRGIGKAQAGEIAAPTWNDRATSDFPLVPGLWAVEPHLARGGIGVKWEELLVVEEHDAYWLDDQVPHLV